MGSYLNILVRLYLDAVLLKTGKLTILEECEAARSYWRENSGARSMRVLSHHPPHHHERWDGLATPDKKRAMKSYLAQAF